MTTVPSETAKLLYHCGVAIQVNYTDSATSGYSSNVEYAMENNFGFQTSGLKSKNSYSASTWINMLKADIDAGRPIYYDGTNATVSPSIAHAWVIDGYKTTDEFHCNWGWGGTHNNWYYLTGLTPPGHNYNSSQHAIIGAEPMLDACSGLSGASLICSTESYSVSIPSTASVVWSKSSNLSQVGTNTSTTFTVTLGTIGTGYVTATIKNSQGQTFLTRTKNVQVGGYRPEIYDLPSSLCEGSSYVVYGSSSQGGYYNWEVYGGTILGGQGTNCLSFSANTHVPPNTSGSLGISLTVNSECNTHITE